MQQSHNRTFITITEIHILCGEGNIKSFELYKLIVETYMTKKIVRENIYDEIDKTRKIYMMK